MWDAADIQEIALSWKRDGVIQEPEAVGIAEYQSDDDDDDFRAEVDFDVTDSRLLISYRRVAVPKDDFGVACLLWLPSLGTCDRLLQQNSFRASIQTSMSDLGCCC